MLHDVGLGAPGLAHELGQAVEQLVVRNRLERSLVFHDRNIGPAFSTSWDGASPKQRDSFSFEGPHPGCDALRPSSALRNASPREPTAPFEGPLETCQEENGADGILLQKTCRYRKGKRSRPPPPLATRRGPPATGGILEAGFRERVAQVHNPWRRCQPVA